MNADHTAIFSASGLPAGQLTGGTFPRPDRVTNGGRRLSVVAVTDRLGAGFIFRRLFVRDNRRTHRLGRLLAISPAIWRVA